MGIGSGMQDVVVAGGVEMMSYTATFPREPGPPLLDSGNLALREMYPMPNVGVAADLIATHEGFTREDADRLALESQRRAANAIAEGYISTEASCRSIGRMAPWP
jgi:acetyl-CoA C-acetyltransferase